MQTDLSLQISRVRFAESSGRAQPAKTTSKKKDSRKREFDD